MGFEREQLPSSTRETSNADGLEFTGVSFRTPLSEIQVERQNNLAINVFSWERGKVVVLRNTNMPSEVEKVSLMFTVNPRTGNNNYSLIKTS